MESTMINDEVMQELITLLTGLEVTTGTEQARAQGKKPREKRSGKTANV